MNGLDFTSHATFAKVYSRKTGFETQLVNLFRKNLNFRASKSKIRLI